MKETAVNKTGRKQEILKYIQTHTQTVKNCQTFRNTYTVTERYPVQTKEVITSK